MLLKPNQYRPIGEPSNSAALVHRKTATIRRIRFMEPLLIPMVCPELPLTGRFWPIVRVREGALSIQSGQLISAANVYRRRYRRRNTTREALYGVRSRNGIKRTLSGARDGPGLWALKNRFAIKTSLASVNHARMLERMSVCH